MMSNNKILTVSYGTFSCTLEGFDDSFGTMKAIAEYFRDLAADDRYFGAEPPQPDAEMLARIAQKEISRRVEARQHEGKIVLSATDELAEPPRAIGAPAAVAPAQDDAGQKDMAQAPAQDMEDIAAEAMAAPDTSAETDSEDQTSAEAEAAADAVAAAVVADTADAIADAVAEQDMDDAAENDIVPGQPDAEVEAFFSAAAPLDTFEEEAEALATPVAAPDTIEPDSIAAKLQRIRAVVAQHDDAEEEADYTEDEHAEAPQAPMSGLPEMVQDEDDEDEEDEQAAVGTDAETFADLTPAPAAAPADLVAETRIERQDALSTEADEADEDDDDIAGILSRLDSAEAEDAAEDNVLIADIAATETLDEDDAHENLFDDDAPEIADIASMISREEADTAAAAKVAASEELRVETEEAPAQDAQRPMPRARVIKVKRADLEAAIQRGDLEEYDEDAAEDDAPVPALDDMAPARVSQSSLSAEEEADLARELAELEADMRRDADADMADAAAKAEAQIYADDHTADALMDDDEEVSDDAADLDEDEDDVAFDDAADLDEDEEKDESLFAEDEPEDAQSPDAEDDAAEMPEETEAREEIKPGRARLLPLDQDHSENVDRLLAEAEQQMDEPESATRRDAFAHLRAAVAARKADEALGASVEEEEDDDAYRSDLAEVVRPRRPVSGSARTPRPGEGRPAPLKLVAEQRIDVARPSGPIRPRRVAAIEDAPAPNSDAESFAEFAAEMGATKLPELLEAAAAYMSFVEGREQFSRPQLMTKVRQVGPDGFSREDGLRSFGQLLRAGKIEKIKGGRFTVSDDIGYRPDERAAG
jgi:hypothetical protein